jgi:hypothetical protein
VGLYVLETIPKVGILFRANGGVRRDNDQSIPHVLIEGKIMEWVSKIQLGLDLCPKEKRQYENLLHKYIHLFVFSYKDFREVTVHQHKIELLLNAKLVMTKQGRWNPKYSTMVKEEFNKLLEARFIEVVEITEWVSPVVLTLKKNGKLRVCVNYKVLNKVIKKDKYPLPFCEEILEEIVRHKMYTFRNGYKGYHQVKIVLEDQLKTTFITPWGTFCYIVMSFGLCNVPKTFQRFMNKIFEPFLGLFL